MKTDYKYIKKGQQYSHHTGTERQNICDYIYLAQDCINGKDEAQAIEYLREAQKHLTELSKKIAYMDRLNKLTN